MFNDQNAEDMSGQLDMAELGYQMAPFHYALMLFDPLSRGWCVFEFMVRFLAAMKALGIERPEDLVQHILDRHPLCTRLVIIDGLTQLRDINGTVFDRYGAMSTFEPADRVMIQRRIVEACGSPAAFNRLLSYSRAAAIQRQVRWTCSAPAS